MDGSNNYLQIAAVCEISDVIKSYLDGEVLDFGCGDGVVTRYLHSLCSVDSIVGYDINKDSIAFALKCRNSREVTFSDSKKMLVPRKYDNVVSTFVLHEAGPMILNELYDVIRDGGRLCVADYHLKGVNREKFAEIFTSDKEMLELGQYGLDKTWSMHTARNLEDCIMDGERAGFKTIEKKIVGNNYFLWVGQK